MNALRPGAGSSIAVFGAGSVGLSAIMAAKVVGCATIIAIDLNEKRLALARELGATHAINGGGNKAAAVIADITGGEGVPCSLECTGLRAAAARFCIRSRPKSMPEPDRTAFLPPARESNCVPVSTVRANGSLTRSPKTLSFACVSSPSFVGALDRKLRHRANLTKYLRQFVLVLIIFLGLEFGHLCFSINAR
jgi:hypothetical protein